MTSIYEELALGSMKWKPADLVFVSECPCGDVFKILVDDLFYGEDMAYCDSCSLVVRVNFTDEDLDAYEDFITEEPVEEAEDNEGAEDNEEQDNEEQDNEEEAKEEQVETETKLQQEFGRGSTKGQRLEGTVPSTASSIATKNEAQHTADADSPCGDHAKVDSVRANTLARGETEDVSKKQSQDNAGIRDNITTIIDRKPNFPDTTEATVITMDELANVDGKAILKDVLAIAGGDL